MTEQASGSHQDSLPKASGLQTDTLHQVSCSEPDSSGSAPISYLNQPTQAEGPVCSSTTGTTTEDSAFLTLLLALRELDIRNESTPCQTPGIDHLWTSDDAEEREAAAHRCQPCPLRLGACLAYAQTAIERHHVWAGLDLTTTTRKEKK